MISGYDIFLSAEGYFVPIIDIVEEFIVAALWDEGTSLNHVISWCSSLCLFSWFVEFVLISHSNRSQQSQPP